MGSPKVPDDRITHKRRLLSHAQTFCVVVAAVEDCRLEVGIFLVASSSFLFSFKRFCHPLHQLQHHQQALFELSHVAVVVARQFFVVCGLLLKCF